MESPEIPQKVDYTGGNTFESNLSRYTPKEIGGDEREGEKSVLNRSTRVTVTS